jgi:hypothetical protein
MFDMSCPGISMFGMFWFGIFWFGIFCSPEAGALL